MDELSIDTNKDVHLINMEQDEFQKNIKMSTVQIKKLKEIAILQDTFIKDIRINLHFVYISTSDTMDLKKFVMVNKYYI